MKRISLAVALTLCACGNTVPDKDKEPFVPNSNSTNNTVGGTANNTVSPTNNATVATNNATTRTNNTAGPTNNTSGPTNNTTANNTTGTTNTTGTNNTTGDCTWDDTWFGQIGSVGIHGGGVPTPSNLSVDAGLDEVLAQVPAEPDDPLTDFDEGYAALTTPLPVRGAIVTATGPDAAGNRRFWVEDRNTPIQVFLAFEQGSLAVGQAVSFDVYALQNFEGHPQIAEILNFSVVSTNNAVPYSDVNSRAITPDDYGKIVRFGGELGQPYDCGGTNCYPVTYAGGTSVLRSKSAFAAPGVCVQYSGPAYSFPGPRMLPSAPGMQVDTINYDWAFFR